MTTKQRTAVRVAPVRSIVLPRQTDLVGLLSRRLRQAYEGEGPFYFTRTKTQPPPDLAHGFF